MSKKLLVSTLSLFCFLSIANAAKITNSGELPHGVNKIQIPRPNDSSSAVSVSPSTLTSLEQEFDQTQFEPAKETAKADEQELQEFGTELE